ncbi:phage tail protein I [Leptotrichia wadei]|uniref:Phage tail protein n=1 Tax=Leptotrichia wadei (strain F0279) TaxID=888055 RepID=U2RLN7_LEPWF|nr:phage tail protein I [Leptotrichia wadei]ERK51637.1 phage tail protein [Leptotrichia wadei F0279]
MITIDNLNLTDIAAKSTLNDKTTLWIYESINFAIKKKHDAIKRKFFLELSELNDVELDFLMWEYHVDYIDSNITRETKIRLIKRSVFSHFNKGTVGGIKEICEILFSGNVEIIEWFKYGGNAGYFKVNTDGNLSDYEGYKKIIEVVEQYKNIRSWLEGIRLLRKEKKTNFYGFIEKNKKKYYLGSTDINIPNEIITTNFGTVHRTRVLREIR